MTAEVTVSKKDRLGQWQGMWDANDINFHKLEPNFALVTYYDRLALGRKDLTIFVPLCGKSVDMIWLHRQGHKVIGVEFAEVAITAFFNEQQLQYSKHQLPHGFRFQTLDGRIKIYQGDLFSFDVETIGKVDVIWDRGSLVAIYKDERETYVNLMRSILRGGFRYMLESLQYEGENARHDVIPRSVNEAEVAALYGDFCCIEVVRIADATEVIKKVSNGGVLANVITLYDYLLTDKNSQ